MSSYTKFIGDTSIPLELLIVAPSGTPITGASPFSKIRRQSDNYYLDFNGGHFKNSEWTAPTLSLNEVGSIYAPGFYNSIWDSHAIITSPGNYAVEYHPNVPGYGPDTDYITFAYDFATAVGSLIVEGSINPVDLKTAIKEIHATQEEFLQLKKKLSKQYTLSVPTNADLRDPDSSCCYKN